MAKQIDRLDTVPAQPTGSNRYVSTLAARLYEASRQAAAHALDAYVSEEDHDRRQAAISAGAAAEWLMLSVICLHDPVLIADRTKPESAIALSRANASSPVDIRNLRTINSQQALGLISILCPSLKVRDDAVFLLEYRNAAAHFGATHEPALREGAGRLAALVAQIHAVLNRDEADYWGPDHTALATKLKDARTTQIAKTLEAKFARAQRNLDEIVRDLGPAEKEQLLIAREGRSVKFSSGVGGDRHDCPLCHRWGWLEYDEVTSEPEEVMVYGGDYAWQVQRSRWAVHFQCPVCGLVLEWDELVPAGLPDDLGSENQDADPPHDSQDDAFMFMDP